ncbi:MAG: ribose 5-phosphate isomerase B [Spirochaetes bacterium]|nr:ribose 5-phosphate isomerase B [Spirochaetota bacterium]NMB66336.1 ribose 5-phosphate isomerase B [Spirochaetota bacterium]
MKIAIGNDHAGVELKQYIMQHFKEHDFINVGTDTTQSCDYPDYIKLVAELVQKGEVDYGIALCGTGIGASIVANKYKGIRAALCTNEFMATMARRHNDANILVLGARVVGMDLAIHITAAFLQGTFEGGRHQRRLDKIAQIEIME